MRAYRPSEFPEAEEDLVSTLQVRTERVGLYARRAEAELPLFEEAPPARQRPDPCRPPAGVPDAIAC